LALLLASTAVWADDAGGLAGLPSTRLEWHPGAVGRDADATGAHSSVEIDARQPNTHAAWSGTDRYPPGPGNDPSTTSVRYVGWAPMSGGTAVGLSMGATTVPPPSAASTALPYDPRTASPSVSPEVGVRLRSNLGAGHRVDVGAWSAYANNPNLAQVDRH